MHVYVLKLVGGRYYVGWSADVTVRIAQHFLGDGALWTQAHPPVQVLSVVQGDTTLEKAITVAMMCEHGFERVRGGPWCKMEMHEPPLCIQKALEWRDKSRDRKRAKRAQEGLDAHTDAPAHTDAAAP